MIRKIGLGIVLCLVFPAILYAWQQFSISSGEITESQMLFNGESCYTTGLYIITNGTNSATVNLYNVASGSPVSSGIKIMEYTVATGGASGGRNFNYPVVFTDGLYVDINGLGASCFVEGFKR